MAITDAYATAAEYRAALSGQDSGNDTQVLLELKACSRFMERRAQTFWTVDVSDATREFYPDPGGTDQLVTVKAGGVLANIRGARELFIPPLSAAPTTIKIDSDLDGLFTDETALASTDYELRPLNAPDGPEAEPYTSIVLTPWGNWGAWPIGAKVQIIGKWGWPAIPDGVKQACIQLTAIWRLESPRATMDVSQGFDTLTAISPQAANIVRELLNLYRDPQY